VLLTAVDVAAANAWLVVAAGERDHHAWPINAIQDSGASRAAGDLAPRVFRGSLTSWQPPYFRESSSQNRLGELAQWERETLFPKHHLPHDISLVESSTSIRLADYETLLHVARQHGPRQPDGSLLPQPTALRLLGTDFLVLPPTQAPYFAQRLPGDPQGWPAFTSLWRMQRTFPRAWVVHEVQALPPLEQPRDSRALEERTREVLFPAGKPRDFLRTAVVETSEPLAEWATMRGNSAAANDSCRFMVEEPQRVQIEVELAQPGLLVLSDTWFPGWQATVTTAGQSREATIYRTNRALRGVWLPKGQHVVEFRYRPFSVFSGAMVSGLAWCVFCGGGAALALRRRGGS
jgi:hypothetical protein